MKMINYITNQDLGITSGGWSGINYNIHEQLSSYFNINYVGPIDPKVSFQEKLSSKIVRSVGAKSKFSFFSDKRLNSIKNIVEPQIRGGDYNLFFGQTAWINCESKKTYGVYLDADFKTYLSIFSTPEKFSTKDIDRIAKKEERWLQKSRDIFVGSEWAWQEMQKYYTLNESQKVIVHTGGNIDLPKTDNYQGGLDLVFISLNFEKKGGYICVEAFEKAQQNNPFLTLTIIGEKPPQKILDIKGVTYAGLLRKTEEKELVKFISIISNAFLLIHPTKMDTMGAVLIEAGYFGCPSIAPNSFGVPELVLNNKTGYIVKVPFQANDFAQKIELLISNENLYKSMRKEAWNFTRNELTWEKIGSKIRDRISL